MDAESGQLALTRPNTCVFDFSGKPMKGWVLVKAEGIRADDALADWVKQGVDFALSLPPKK